jgi:pentatricopeptide repeat protein
VISAITKSKEMDAPNRAEKFLRDLGTTDAYGEIAPNRITFNNVINAWAKAGSPDRAEEILLRMEELSKHGVPDVAPDAISFSTVIVSRIYLNELENHGYDATTLFS